MTWLCERGIRSAIVVTMLGVGLACSDDGVPAQGPVAGGTGEADTGAPTTGVSTATDGMTGPEEGTSADGSEDATASGDDTGTDGPAPRAVECSSDADCMVVNDCCTCAAQPVEDEVPPCDVTCVQSKCDEQRIPEIGAACRLGVCVFDKLSCDDSEVVCLALPPGCPDGYLPEVEGDCWSGACVPDFACDVVPGCEHCSDSEGCVEIETQLGPLYTCEPIPAACAGKPSCACMAEACTEPHDTCIDVDDGLQCACLAC